MRLNCLTFDTAFCTQLLEKAQVSPRRRAHFNVHETYTDMVQRLYVAMLPDSYVRPHKHSQPTKWEFFMVVQGSIDLLFFDDAGTLVLRQALTAGGECFAMQIPPNTWHATICREPVVFFEVKQGPYEALTDKNFASWSPEEGASSVEDFTSKMASLVIGDSLR